MGLIKKTFIIAISETIVTIENGIYIKGQSGYADYYPGFGWFGTLTYLNHIESYQIFVARNCTAYMSGLVATPEFGENPNYDTIGTVDYQNAQLDSYVFDLKLLKILYCK